MTMLSSKTTSLTLSKGVLLLTSNAAISVPSSTAPPRIARPMPAPMKSPPKTAVRSKSGVTSGKGTTATQSERPAIASALFTANVRPTWW